MKTEKEKCLGVAMKSFLTAGVLSMALLAYQSGAVDKVYARGQDQFKAYDKIIWNLKHVDEM